MDFLRGGCSCSDTACQASATDVASFGEAPALQEPGENQDPFPEVLAVISCEVVADAEAETKSDAAVAVVEGASSAAQHVDEDEEEGLVTVAQSPSSTLRDDGDQGEATQADADACVSPAVVVPLKPMTVRANSGPTSMEAPSSAARKFFASKSLRTSQLANSGEFSSLSDNVVELLTFAGCKDLCRASRLADVLCGQARIFQDSAGSAQTYELSKQATHINIFISHNWSVKRIHKFLTLSFRFNCSSAALVTLAEMSMLGVANSFGVLSHISTESNPYPIGVCCRLLCAPTFFLVMVFAQDMRRWAGFLGPRVFLDKTCIHQVDREIQRRGIKKLGAFMCNSDEMLVVYTDVYLLKLWTVYEIAAFLPFHSIDKMKVISIVVPMMFYSALILYWSLNVLGLLTELVDGPAWVAPAFDVVIGLIFMFTVRRRARDKLMIQLRLSDFSIRNCTCFDEGDRPVVYANIADLMRGTQDDLVDEDDEHALQHFDTLVRSELARVLISSMGRFSVPYHYIVYAMGFTRGANGLDLLAGIPHGLAWREVLIKELYFALEVFGIFPLLFAGCELLAGKFLQLKGCKEVAWVVFIIGLASGAHGAFSWPEVGACRVFAAESRTSNAALVAYAVLCCSVCGFAFLAYSPYVKWSLLVGRCNRRQRSS
mmetsp:Transcript_107315/g.346545  ORF Transcript_107315/g.346545 Transcript_107315/m.346545 type:complete len:658 (+) Transcript_107315:82-2055(+)